MIVLCLHLLFFFHHPHNGAIRASSNKTMTNDAVSVKSEMERGQCVHTTRQAWPQVDSQEICRFTVQLECRRIVPASHDYNGLFQKDEKMEEAKSAWGQGVCCAATGQVGVSLSSMRRGVFPCCLSASEEPGVLRTTCIFSRTVGAGRGLLFNSLVPGSIFRAGGSGGNTGSCLNLIGKKDLISSNFTPSTHLLPRLSGQLWVLFCV